MRLKKAFALILVLVTMSTLTVFGGILLVLAFNRLFLVQLEMDRVKALFLAEAGYAQALFEIKTQQDPDGDGMGNIREQLLGEGSFSVIHRAKNREIRSTGCVNGVKRTVMIKYALN